MSKPRYRWWGYVKAVIRAYPYLEKKRGEMLAPAITPRYNGVGGKSGVSDPTGNQAVRELSGQEQKEYEAVRMAIRVTRRLPSGRDRLKIIDMVFWQRSHTIEGAARLIPCGGRTAARYHGQFIHLVAFYLGLKDGITEPKRHDKMVM